MTFVVFFFKMKFITIFFFFSSRRRHTRFDCDWSSDVCSSDLKKSTPPREWVDLNEVIREMVVLLRGEATRYSILVRTELAPDPALVMGDRVLLQQVMMNLMTNGTDAMKEVEGTRELAIKSQRADKEECRVSVSDTGVGLPAQQADQIFDAFFTTKP